MGEVFGLQGIVVRECHLPQYQKHLPPPRTEVRVHLRENRSRLRSRKAVLASGDQWKGEEVEVNAVSGAARWL